MPRVYDEIRSCSFYLYPDLTSARSGDPRGASGFVIVALDDGDVTGLSYAVTAGHVVGQAEAVRFNRRDGGVFVKEWSEDRWFRSVTHDIAVTPLHDSPTADLDIFLMPVGIALSRERCVGEDVGVGDEVFTVGRLLAHDGGEENQPTVRFGAISMMPEVPVPNHITGLREESFLIEFRSVSGYSGSPVFLYRDREPLGPNTRLLGWVWGHLAEPDHQGNLEHSGLAAVTPAWALLDLLYSAEVAEERHRILGGAGQS